MSNDEDKGHYVCYVPRNFRDKSLELIDTVNIIVKKYEEAGMIMTVRQIYYQLVKANVIANRDESYDSLVALIGNARLAGLISWTAIEDRGRNMMGLSYQRSPQNAVKNVLASYRLDKWADQEWRPEVWVEKAALESVIGMVCNQLQVDFFACRGYNSLSEQWRAGRRLSSYVAKGQRPIIFHLGDHDPSGLDMTRDNRDRLTLFAGIPVTVVRLALSMQQVEELKLPPNPAKQKDVRFADYALKYGESSWELDALETAYIHDLIEKNVLRIRENDKWDRAIQRETEDKMTLEEMIERSGGHEEVK